MLPGSEITFKFIFLQTNPLPDARERSHYTIKLTANSPFQFNKRSQLFIGAHAFAQPKVQPRFLR
jgi:hypothetical protein